MKRVGSCSAQLRQRESRSLTKMGVGWEFASGLGEEANSFVIKERENVCHRPVSRERNRNFER
jgi:hypothetical protein